MFQAISKSVPRKINLSNVLSLKAVKALTAIQLIGIGSAIHLHSAFYEKAIKDRKAGCGVRLDIVKY